MSAIETMKADLARLRDEAKVQAHLGSMEAKNHWEELEAKWNHFTAQAGLQESADDIKSAAQLLGQELREAYQRLVKSV